MDNSIQFHINILDVSNEERHGGPGLFCPFISIPLKIIKAINMVLVRKNCGVRKIESLSERTETVDSEEKS